MGNFNQQELANTASENVFVRRTGGHSPPTINTVWAFATSGRKNASLFAALATAAAQRMGNFNSQDLDNTA